MKVKARNFTPQPRAFRLTDIPTTPSLGCAAGEHIFPSIWLGTVPPPCERCGQAYPTFDFILSDALAV